jgi:transposase-like protein
VAGAEIITRRRKFNREQKALAEVDAEGGRLAMVARRQGTAESLLYNWHSARKAGVGK